LAGIQANALATDFVMVAGAATGAAGAGILLNGVNGAFIEDATAEGNGKFGIWLKSASNNAIDGFVAESNGIVGVYLGCNTDGPNGTTCAPEPFSSGNSLSGSAYGAKNSVVSNTGSPLNQKYGVAVDGGDLHNHITATTGRGNTLEDAVDGNGCGSNRWFGNSFTNSSPAKGAGFFCIN
jgi:parallel beta-helix repeat protein